jgi:hypothetical protein
MDEINQIIIQCSSDLSCERSQPSNCNKTLAGFSGDFAVHHWSGTNVRLGNCGHVAGRSSPKRLDFTEIRIGFRSHGHRLLDPCVLKSGQKAGGERAARVGSLTGDTYCRDSFLVDSDVVKVAEPILQAAKG